MHYRQLDINIHNFKIRLIAWSQNVFDYFRWEYEFFLQEMRNSNWIDKEIDLIIQEVGSCSVIDDAIYLPFSFIRRGYSMVCSNQSIFIQGPEKKLMTLPFRELKTGRTTVTFESGFDVAFLFHMADIILRFIILHHGKAFVHAAGIVYDNKGILVSGWAQTGKTSLLLEFMKDGANPLGDDSCLIARNGTLYSYPIPINISNFHILHWHLEKYLSFQERLALHSKRYRILLSLVNKLPFIGKRINLRRSYRFHLDNLFGNSVYDSCELNICFLLYKTREDTGIKIKTLSKTDAVKSFISSHEHLKLDIFEYKIMSEYADGDNCEESHSFVSNFKAIETEILTEAFEGKALYGVYFDSKVSFAELKKELEKYL